MPTANALSYYRGTIFMNYQQMGWSENIDIASVTDASALSVLKSYAAHRAWTLPAQVTIVYGRVTKVPFQRYSIALDNLPLVGKAPNLTTPNIVKPNDAMVAPCFHFIADEGKSSIRFFRGVPDDRVLDMQLVDAPPAGSWVDLVGPVGDGTANPSTWDVALKNVFSFIAQTTVVASKKQILNIAGVDQEGYRLRIFTGILSRQARKKDTGRPFGSPRGRAPAHS